MKATFIGRTNNRGQKNRWECPACRLRGDSECRFNLSPTKVNVTHRCRFCGTELELRLEASRQ